MANYEVGQICMNGHVINPYVNRFPVHCRKYCEKCGEKTITKCPSCEVEIRGNPFLRDSAPAYCHNCGRPYPWTESKIRIAKEIVKELEGLESADRDILNKSIEDIASNNLKTDLAIVRVKKVIKKYSGPVGKVVYKIFVDIASETIKKVLKGE